MHTSRYHLVLVRSRDALTHATIEAMEPKYGQVEVRVMTDLGRHTGADFARGLAALTEIGGTLGISEIRITKNDVYATIALPAGETVLLDYIRDTALKMGRAIHHAMIDTEPQMIGYVDDAKITL